MADFFPQTGIFAGFSLHIINLAIKISAATMAGDLIYFSVAGPVGYYTGAHTVIFRGVFSLYYSPERRAKLRWSGGGGGALYLLGCRIAYKGAMGGARGGEYYISKPRLYSGNIRPWLPRTVAHLGCGVP